MNYLHPERLDRLAREYALGTLAGPARRRFETVMRSSPSAARAVTAWQARLSVLEQVAAPVAPPASNWAGIQQRLFGPEAAPPRSMLGALRDLFSVRIAGSALAGFALCVLVLSWQPGLFHLEAQSDSLPASYVGLLLDGQGKPALVASSRRQGRQLTVKLLQPIAAPPGQVAQLWALPKDGSAPMPIGTLPPNGSAQIALPAPSEKLFYGVDRLAVSFEKAPAVAGAAPSSFVWSGHCVKVW